MGLVEKQMVEKDDGYVIIIENTKRWPTNW